MEQIHPSKKLPQTPTRAIGETRWNWQSLAMPLTLVALWGFFACLNPQFLGPRNLSMLMIELAVTATLAVGMLLIILPGHIDLSAGSGVGLLGGIAAVMTFRWNIDAPLAMIAVIMIGALIWMAMGWSIVAFRIQAFVITLGGLLVFKGLFWLVIESSTVPIVGSTGPNWYGSLTTAYVPPLAGLAMLVPAGLGILGWLGSERSIRLRAGLFCDSWEMIFLKGFVAFQIVTLAVLVCNRYRGIPVAALILGALALLVHILVSRTVFGRYLVAVGGNAEAAYASGVPVDRTVVSAFAIMGGIVALSGLMQTAYAGASTTTVGELMELDAIAACVIGGASLRGGRGTVLGTLFGALIMASLLNGMTLLAVAPEFKLIVRGIVLVLAVLMDLRFQAK